MKEYIQNLLRAHSMKVAIVFVLIIICANAVLVLYYRNVIINNAEISQNIQRVKDGLNAMDTNVRLADIGVRAYIIRQTQ